MTKFGSGVLGGTPVGFYRTRYESHLSNVAILAVCEGECEDEDFIDGEPFGDISINLSNKMEPGEFVVNHDMEIYENDLVKTGLFQDTGKRVNYGFVSQRPIWRLITKE
ncbi:MAG: hypothetical protein WC824_05995 [Bacteroidota bacterium]|jgi:hypothetical protein